MENNFHLLTPEYWAELEKTEPATHQVFKDWLVDYKMRIGWDDIFANGMDFYNLPSDMQHGILSRFYFEAGELHDDLARTLAKWPGHTKYMFVSLHHRLTELDFYKNATK